MIDEDLIVLAIQRVQDRERPFNPGNMGYSFMTIRLAGAAGFEPANAGTKNRCLTTWRRPSSVRGYIETGRGSKSL